MARASFDRYLGCVLGGAAGDALGYPIEFWGEWEIQDRFGDGGIRTLREAGNLNGTGVAVFSDDTQMTLFTAAGLTADMRAKRPLLALMGVWDAYGLWRKTQYGRRGKAVDSDLWLMGVEGLWASRAPGMTCLSAIDGGVPGTPEDPINASKGCGGIMRVAPCALASDVYCDGSPEAVAYAAELAARVAALTHGHPLGWLSAAALASCVAAALHEEPPEEATERGMSLAQLVRGATAQALAPWRRGFASACTCIETGVERAIELAERAAFEGADPAFDLGAVHELGEGWVGEEALFVALYAALAHADDVEAALACAVNHKGDSDSTGAVCGNLLGAWMGAEALGEVLDLDFLEQTDVLERAARELYEARS